MDIRELCTYLFTHEGYNVNGYGNVASFLSAKTKPNLFLLDVQLPDGNGLDVCEKLKSNPIYTNIPVIIMSAQPQKGALIKNCHADDFVEKPFDIDKLLQRVAKLIN